MRTVARTITAVLIGTMMLTGGASVAAADAPPTVQAAGVEIPKLTTTTTRTGGSRPAVPAEATRPANRVSGAAALVSPQVVSATVKLGERPASLIIPDSALPWKFSVDNRLSQRFGQDAVVNSVRQWDGVPGSRWATTFTGGVASGSNAADGRSIVFLENSCPAGVGGYTYWQTSTGQADTRYGESAVYLTEVDIGVCPAIGNATALQALMAHEVGHAFGLQHLWNKGQEGWQAGMGSGHECRIMYGASSGCPRKVSQVEHDGAVHVYSTLRRMSGPTRLETAARASYADFGPRKAATVVLARGDQTAHSPLSASALAAINAGPMLLGVADNERCVAGSTEQELARVIADQGKVVLVGDWPKVCDTRLAGWGLKVERVTGADPVALSVAVADQVKATGRMGGDVFVVSAAGTSDGHLPDGVAAGAAAGAARGPVLFTAPGALSAPVKGWLGQAKPRRAYVVGGPAAVSEQVVADLRGLGLEVVRVAGADRVATSLALAGRGELFPAGGKVIVAAAHAWADAVTASSIGGRLRAPVVLSPAAPHPAVQQWLAQHRPAGGFIVGGRAVLPDTLQWQYSRLVR